jgi:hypothetical protein
MLSLLGKMPTPTTTRPWSRLRHVDHDRAWKVLCRVDREGLLILMARASRSVPLETVGSIFSGYALPHEIGDAEPAKGTSLLEAVSEFTEAALRGRRECFEEWMGGVVRGGPAVEHPVLVQLLLPIETAPELLRRLAWHRVDASAVYAGHLGAAEAVRERRFWDMADPVTLAD